jgi:hypothetical protein
MKNNVLAITGLGLLFITALSLAAVAAFESVVGLADLFAAKKETVIVMAIVIEWAKLLFVGSIHMFWKTIPWWKWGCVFIILVHMAVTNIGIYNYLSSGYTLQKAPVAAIERQIRELDRRVGSQGVIASEAVRRIEAMDVAYREYVENLFIRRAEQYKRDNAELRTQLETQRDEARRSIARMEEDRAVLEEEKVKNAAKLGSIEHITVVAGQEENVLKMIALFTLLLVMGLDPAAILMIILFTHFLGMLVREEKPELPVPEPIPEPIPEPALSDEVLEEAKRLEKIGFMKNRLKKKPR